MKIFGIFLIIILSNSTNIYGQTVVVGQKKDSVNATHTNIICSTPALTTGNSPLLVIRANNLVFMSNLEDSFPFNKIKPIWIESMKIIKGPEATAKYGTRAKDVVILVELKQEYWSVLPLEIRQKFKPSN